MINRSFPSRLAAGAVQPRRFAQPHWQRVALLLLLSVVTIGLAACGQRLYRTPEYNFAGRPTPPSKLQQRVLVSLTLNGSSGALQILDGYRDLRNNVQNTVSTFSISGFNGGYPSMIANYPEQLRGLVYSNASPIAITNVNYGTEATGGTAAQFGSPASSFATASDFIRLYVAQPQTGQLLLSDSSTGAAVTYTLNLPNVTKVIVNQGDTVAMALVKNSNSVYRVVKLNPNSGTPPGAVDCQPNVVPVYCVVPVPGTYDRPVDVVYSPDGANAYVLNCGVECGGGGNGGAGVSFIPQGTLQINNVPTALPYPAVVTSRVSVPGGVTTAISDGTTLYMAGQQLLSDGLLTGRLSTMNLTSLAVSAPIAISDGTHTKMLFADDSTLWIGSSYCANGERAKLGLNYNCLTRYSISGATASVVPAINTATASVPYPNTDNNLLYLGSLTGICWVQNYHKVYTAYGGQIHAFNTADGSEINNQFITVQGTALDVAYMDALTNQAN